MDSAPDVIEPTSTQSAHAAAAVPRSNAVLRATLAATLSDRVSLTAARRAFYATLALFPATSILISIYGLAYNPGNVDRSCRRSASCCRGQPSS